MRHKPIMLICVILLITMLISACGDPIAKLTGRPADVGVFTDKELLEEEEAGLRSTVLYYRDNKGLLVPVMRRIPWEEGIAKSAINQLVDSPAIRDYLSSFGLLPVLPASTNILGMSINEGLCKVDFNKGILDYSNESDEKSIVSSLVYTLTEFESIDRVQILVNGQLVDKLKYGTKIKNPLEREKINLSYELSKEHIPVIVYYKGTVNGENSFYVPVTKGIAVIKADVKSVLNALLEGAPEGSGLFSEIPAGTNINDIYVKDGIAYVDFSEEIKRVPQNSETQQSIVYEVGLTLKEIEPTISQVRLLSGGREIELDKGVSLNIPRYSNSH